MLFEEGLYVEQPLILRRDVHVFARPGQCVMIACSGSRVVTSVAAKATLSGLTIRRTAGDGNDDCVWIRSGGLQLQHCTLTSDTMAAIAVSGPGSHPSIIACTIQDSPVGILFERDSLGQVVDCLLESNLEGGIISMSRAAPHVSGCRIIGTGSGASGAEAHVVEGGQVRPALHAGIAIVGGHGSYVGNEIRSCALGIRVRGGSRALLTRNTATLNFDAGIEVIFVYRIFF